jgi:drug/metabolite transporter (DMT)-like permease
MATYYRKMDTLSAVTYRGLSLAISMSPILFWVPKDQFGRIDLFVLPILGASILALLGNWAMAFAFRYLPVGIANSLLISFSTIIAALVSYLFYGEVISILQIVLIVAVLSSIFTLGLAKSNKTILIEIKTKKGIAYSFLFGLMLGGGYTLIGMTSRQLHPFLVGYAWETTIGFIGVAIALGRGVVGGKFLSTVDKKEFGKILLAAFPTTIGTGFYALSMTMGPVAIATAILSTTMVFTTVMAHFVHHEQLTRKQWLLMILVCVFVFVLKIVSE